MSDKIQIAVRVRPFASFEKGQDNIINMEGNITKITNPTSKEVKEFKFNKCFWSHDDTHGGLKTNSDVFQDLGQTLLTNAFSGFNATIFAYG